MEYLSRSLKILKGDKKFRFHPRCARFNLVQLEFADDLLLFCKGDVQYVQILHQLFQQFSATSGLIANPNKSCIYFRGVNQLTRQKIVELLDRAVLVKSVLFATQTFWAQIFMLPKKVIQFIETMCRRFLWTGNAEPIRKALIAWEKLCSPKVAGGLNFIDVELWNEVAICKLLWNIYTRKEKLWIHWVHTYYIKGHTVWSTEPKSASWAIQKIFQAKEYFAKPGLNEEDVQRMRLATKERLARWGVVTDQTCSLCNKEIETVQHMFFKCEITGKIWNGLLSWQGIQRTQHAWQEEITWLAKVTKGKSARAAICRMTLAAAVYHCWQ
uniref:Reverse transcriptase zinc-binding domain-containing protein n=2 Tax=Nicotiana TaxID=4085 RepID=A0A1S4B7G8_TOBAC|nr:PREDICTED: uncharacterized protein LOC104218229 [Nicotiana sylvestris]XP_016484890.1 PREDICTED: uncharacterized protein LOC107805375 [Nicotiana tabacum]